MQIHELQREHSEKPTKRIGRGGKRGTYSGRGIKGQKSRAGRHMRPQLRDEIKKLPKRRGYGVNRSRTVNSSKQKAAVVAVGVLERISTEGEIITPGFLKAKGVITKLEDRKKPIKILGGGTLTKKLTISGCLVSNSAKKTIESVGGTIETKNEKRKTEA
ncbi:uL15 family ribosomal protein [Patescibacteria group bacterium]|nr:uL15 family ribosomal protein [Patescibacteria group bacterium]